ncbi:MAG: hypothetical protein GY795_22785 [Desulfobacterales bacterium]|nr:hypothetical protein [Desulfobacterales bacterium]
MEIIKQIVRIPENHEIKIPQHIPKNEIAEVVLFIRKDCDSFSDKINKLREAVKDDLFTNDLKDISSDFQSVDLEE